MSFFIDGFLDELVKIAGGIVMPQVPNPKPLPSPNPKPLPSPMAAGNKPAPMKAYDKPSPSYMSGQVQVRAGGGPAPMKANNNRPSQFHYGQAPKKVDSRLYPTGAKGQ